MDMTTVNSSGNGGHGFAETDDGGSGMPDTWRDFPQWFNDEPPDTLPTGQEPQEYATDVVVIAGCETNPNNMAVAAQHQTEALCEHIVMLAARNDDGDFYEIGLPFVWDVMDPEVVALPFSFGPQDNYALPIGMYDTFDFDGENEPQTKVIGCAINTCPDPRPADCADLVCASAKVLSVINLEGGWTLSGTTFDDGADTALMQDGRTFKDMNAGVKHGFVNGTAVQFDIDDYRYEGTIAPDRNHMGGQVWELMTLTLVGDWEAERTLQ